MILEEFDSIKKAVINPEHYVEKIEGIPPIAISCFSSITFDRLLEGLEAEEIFCIGTASCKSPVYKARYRGREIVLFKSLVGAPVCVGGLEEVRALGVEKFILFGTCGVLDKTIKDCSIIIPTTAIRDEGTSYHYAESSDDIKVNTKYVNEFIEILKSHNVDYHLGKVWTTDAFYRETPQKVQKRKRNGCNCVDMECSAVAAFAQFRNVDVFHFFYAADNLDSVEWDKRSLDNKDFLLEKDRIAVLALELAVDIYEK